MTSIFRIQEVLAKRPGEKLQAYQIAARAETTADQFCKHVSKWLARGHLSRERVKGRGWCYYLSEQQLHAYRLKQALASGSFDGSLVTDTDDLHARLAFLRMLKEKTVIGEHAMLGKVIEDYTRTLRLREACRQRADEGSEAPRKKPVKKVRAAKPGRLTGVASLDWKQPVSMQRG